MFEEQSERQVVKAMGKRQQQPQQEQRRDEPRRDTITSEILQRVMDELKRIETSGLERASMLEAATSLTMSLKEMDLVFGKPFQFGGESS